MATTILDLKVAIANYFELTVDELIVNGQDLGLLALNQVRRQAELNHDFEFQRELVTVSVDGVTGGSLENAVLHSDGVTGVNVKSVIEVGLFDANGNLRPVEWTTVAESIERQRGEERYALPQWRAEDETCLSDRNVGLGRFAVAGSKVFRFPKASAGTTITYALGFEVYAFSSEWTATSDIVTVSDITTYVGMNGVGEDGVEETKYHNSCSSIKGDRIPCNCAPRAA